MLDGGIALDIVNQCISGIRLCDKKYKENKVASVFLKEKNCEETK